MLNKSATIGTGLTWMIATIVILILMLLFLVASGFFTPWKGFIKKDILPLRFPEHQQSLFAISKNPEITNFLQTEKYKEAKTKIEPLLSRLTILSGVAVGGWKLGIIKNDEVIITANPVDVIGWYDSQNFYLRLNPEIKLRLYLECEADSCYDYGIMYKEEVK